MSDYSEDMYRLFALEGANLQSRLDEHKLTCEYCGSPVTSLFPDCGYAMGMRTLIRHCVEYNQIHDSTPAARCETDY